MWRKGKTLMMGGIICCTSVIFAYIHIFHNYHCIDVRDRSYLPPIHLVEKWKDYPQKQDIDQVLVYTKFPLRNPQSITERLENFTNLMQPVNDFLAQLELQTTEEIRSWKVSMTQTQFNQLDDVAYLKEIASLSSTKVITTDFKTLQNLLQPVYYNVTATNCTDFAIRAVDSDRSKIGTSGCSDDPSKTLYPSPLQVHLVRQGETFHTDYDMNSIPVTYVHALKHAFVDGTVGDISTEKFDIIIQRCAMKNHQKASLSQVHRAQQFDKVFTIAQYWGEGYYHHNSEQLPRLLPYIAFLKGHPDIYIHVCEIKTFAIQSLEVLGISKSRIISGDIRAKILYAPVGGRCGSLPIIPGQMMSLLLRQKIDATPERRSIIFIQRSYKRYFKCHCNIKDMLEEEALEYGLNLEIYGDNPSPSRKETAECSSDVKLSEMFNRAVMIVAPHGAGLANMLYSEPGTVVIEGACFDWFNPDINHCYKKMAMMLGHRYAAINYPTTSCHYLQAADIKPVVEYFLKSLLLKS